MKKSLIILLFCLVNHLAIGQSGNPILEARITFIEDVKSIDSYPNIAVAISFINNSDKDIYIPRIFMMIQNPNKDLLTFYKKDSLIYRNLSLMPKLILPLKFNVEGHAEATGSLNYATALTRKFNYRNVGIDARLISIIKAYNKKNRVNLDSNLLTEFNDKPLFLKAREERQYYITYPLTPLLDRPGEYKVTFEPQLKELGMGFPDFIMNYKKYIPKSIKANSIFFHFDSVSSN